MFCIGQWDLAWRFQPVWKFCNSQIGSSPQVRMKIKIVETTTKRMFQLQQIKIHLTKNNRIQYHQLHTQKTSPLPIKLGTCISLRGVPTLSASWCYQVAFCSTTFPGVSPIFWKDLPLKGLGKMISRHFGRHHFETQKLAKNHVHEKSCT